MQHDSDSDCYITGVTSPPDVEFVREDITPAVSGDMMELAGAFASLAAVPAPEHAVEPEPDQPIAVSGQAGPEPNQPMPEPDHPVPAFERSDDAKNWWLWAVTVLTGALGAPAVPEIKGPSTARVLLTVYGQPKIACTCTVESKVPIKQVSVVIPRFPEPRVLRESVFGTLAINRSRIQYDIVEVTATQDYTAMDALLDAATTQLAGKGYSPMDSLIQHAEDRLGEDYFPAVDAFHENIQACEQQIVKLSFGEDDSTIHLQWIGTDESSRQFLMELKCERQTGV